MVYIQGDAFELQKLYSSDLWDEWWIEEDV